MQKVIGVILMCAAMAVNAEQWHLLTGNDFVRLLIDLDSIMRRNDLVEGRVRLLERNGEATTQDNMKFVMACGTHRGGIVEWATYQSTKNSGTQLKKYQSISNVTSESLNVITPATYGEAIWSFTCTWQTMKDKLLLQLPLTQ